MLLCFTCELVEANQQKQFTSNFPELPNVILLIYFMTPHVHFVFTVPYRTLQTQVVGVGQPRARLLPDPHPRGLCPGEAHIVGASGAPAVKPPAVTLQRRRVGPQHLSSRSRTPPSSALSTCNLCLSEFDAGLLIDACTYSETAHSPKLCSLVFFCRTETALKNQEMELIRNKERLQFFKVQHKANMFFLLHHIRQLERKSAAKEKCDLEGNALFYDPVEL